MKDIGQEVGVSQATVSYVLNGRADQSISAATRRSVTEAAERLGYRPNRLARALVTARTSVLGALVTSLPGSWDANLAEAIEEAASERDCAVMLGCSRWNSARERLLVERFLESRVDGLLVLPTSGADPGWYQALVDDGTRLVFMVTAPAGVAADSVLTDNHRAGYLVGQHFAQLGRRHFAYVSPPVLHHPEDEQRWAGFAAAARDSSLDPPDLVKVPPPAEWGATYEAMVEYLRGDPPVDAVFACDDYMAFRVMRALQESGRRLPEEVAVAGFDDLRAATAVPPLTTIRAPMQEIGEQAVAMLVRRIQEEGAPRPPQHVFVEPTLIVRESSVGLQA
jgi:LacI family transcriptional regulator